MVVEMFRIRSSLQALKDVMPSLQVQVKDINEKEAGADITILTQPRNEGNLAVFIAWNDERPDGRSKEGFMIAETLQDTGIISHEVWTDDLYNLVEASEIGKEG